MRGGGGGKGLRNIQILPTNSTDRLCEMRARGREGVKNPEILRTSFMNGPLHLCILLPEKLNLTQTHSYIMGALTFDLG